MKIQDIIKEDVSVGATGSANVGAISMPIGTISTRTGSRPKTRGRPRKKSVKEVSTSDGDQTSPNKPKKIPMLYKQWDIEKLQLEISIASSSIDACVEDRGWIFRKFPIDTCTHFGFAKLIHFME